MERLDAFSQTRATGVPEAHDGGLFLDSGIDGFDEVFATVDAHGATHHGSVRAEGDGFAQVRSIDLAFGMVDRRLCLAATGGEAFGDRADEGVDGQQALDMAQAHRPDLILMDIQLPEISGLDVTKRIKALDVDGKKVHTIGIPIHYGFKGATKPGFITNTLTPFVGDANTQTPEYKAFLVNIEKA